MQVFVRSEDEGIKTLGSSTVERHHRPSQRGKQALTIYALKSNSFHSDPFSDFASHANLLTYLRSSPELSTDTTLTGLTWGEAPGVILYC
jgi:hypothetical protein